MSTMSSRLPSAYSLSHLENHILMHDLVALVVRDRDTTAVMLAHIAEVDARRLYAPAGYPSMFAYCVGELRMSEDAAFKRIRAARMARQFPAIFAAVAEGRLTLSGVVLLAPHLTPANADGLLAAATHRSKLQVEALLAERFPQPDLPTLVWAIGPATSGDELAPGPVGVTNPEQATLQVGAGASQLAPGPVGVTDPEQATPWVPKPGNRGVIVSRLATSAKQANVSAGPAPRRAGVAPARATPRGRAGPRRAAAAGRRPAAARTVRSARARARSR
jgi:hypothetical protein